MDGQTLDDPAAGVPGALEKPSALGLPGLPAVPAPVHSRQRRLRPTGPAYAKPRRTGSRALARPHGPGRPLRAQPRRCPADRRNGSPSPGRWPPSREVLLLDEPLAALDARARIRAWAELRRHLRTFAGARLLVAHGPLDALVLADRLVVEAGRVPSRHHGGGPPPPVGVRRPARRGQPPHRHVRRPCGAPGVGGRAGGGRPCPGARRWRWRCAPGPCRSTATGHGGRRYWQELARVVDLEADATGSGSSFSGQRLAIVAEVTPQAVAELRPRPRRGRMGVSQGRRPRGVRTLSPARAAGWPSRSRFEAVRGAAPAGRRRSVTDRCTGNAFLRWSPRPPEESQRHDDSHHPRPERQPRPPARPAAPASAADDEAGPAAGAHPPAGPGGSLRVLAPARPRQRRDPDGGRRHPPGSP